MPGCVIRELVQQTGVIDDAIRSLGSCNGETIALFLTITDVVLVGPAVDADRRVDKLEK